VKNFTKIDCAEKGGKEIMTREAIHEEVYKKVQKVI
jgi:hypothetical protein